MHHSSANFESGLIRAFYNASPFLHLVLSTSFSYAPSSPDPGLPRRRSRRGPRPRSPSCLECSSPSVWPSQPSWIKFVLFIAFHGHHLTPALLLERPDFKRYHPIQVLSPDEFPTGAWYLLRCSVYIHSVSLGTDDPRRRVILLGDIHGMAKALR